MPTASNSEHELLPNAGEDLTHTLTSEPRQHASLLVLNQASSDMASFLPTRQHGISLASTMTTAVSYRYISAIKYSQ